jgi:hypothetical protein
MPETTQTSQDRDSFVGDLRSTVHLWRVQPLVPIVAVLILGGAGLFQSLAIWVNHLPAACFSRLNHVPACRHNAGLAAAEAVEDVLIIVTVGWICVTRIWYLRLQRGRTLRLRESITLGGRFFGRVVRLGFLDVGLWLLLMLPFAVVLRHHRGIVAVVLFAYLVVTDICLTFIVPALAFTTGEARQAIVLGLRMLRSAWPRSAPYALAPGVVLIAMAKLLPYSHIGVGGAAVLAVATSLLHSAFVGATTQFYLRRVDVPDDGAATFWKQKEAAQWQARREEDVLQERQAPSDNPSAPPLPTIER